jgi:hypothetical protein
MTRASLIDHDRKLIITINFKCASTQIIEWFRSNIKDYIHTDLKLSKAINRKYTIDPYSVQKFYGYYKMIVVRNPYYRLVSCFLDKGFAKFNPLIQLCSIHNISLENLTFRLFVRMIRTQPEEEMNGHWRPYSVRINPNHYQRTIKLEELNKDMDIIAQKFNMTQFPSNKRVNKRKNGSLMDIPLKELIKMDKDLIRTYKNYYDLGLKYKVKKLYKKDFIKFGYSIKLLNEN